ncbi:MAG: subclass B3 metallo-beta-lactamase [Bryobacterales bacterium]|nr:subclass B3 metallo-beta-lactamase [Bryobacterales bacterium]
MIFFPLALLLAAGQFTPANPEWNQPVAPFRIAGNLYYVGASGVSSFLITTPEGHYLLDTGFSETVPQIEANIQKLGFRLSDVRFLLISHGHYDHIAGVASLKARTKAKLLANPAEAPLLQRGGKGDFAFADRFPYPPVTPDRMLHDGEQISLGGTVMTAHFTPGHTKGCTSWTTTVKEDGKDLRVVIPCSVSAPGYQLVNNPKYPEIQKDFAASIAKLRALPSDIFVSPHGWDFDLEGKVKARAAVPTRNPFIDPKGLPRYLDKSEAAIREALAKQQRR